MTATGPNQPALRALSLGAGGQSSALTLLSWLADHGVLTSFQIAHALFPSVDFAQRRLRKLVHLGVIDRFRPQKSDGGSYPYHYLLDQLGVEVVSAQRGEELPRKDTARKRRWYLTNRANLPHLLGLNQLFIDLAGHARTHLHAHLERWWPASRCARVGALAHGHPDPLVRAYTPRVRPDGHGVWIEHEMRVPFFVEYDTGTEQLSRLVDKLIGYADLFEAIDQLWPVLFWLHSAVREQHLHRRLTEAGTSLPVATAARDDAARTGRSLAEDIWWLHRHGGPLRHLADLVAVVVDARGGAQ